MTTSSFIVRRLDGHDSPQLFEQISILHGELIHGGVLPLLGNGFLSVLYREIAKSRWGSVHVALEDESILGFLVGAQDVYRCARSFTPGGYLKLFGLLMTRMWRPAVLSKLFDSLAYPFRSCSTPTGTTAAPPPRHRAELLSIAVAKKAQGRGVGKALVRAFEATMLGQVTQYAVTTNASEADSNAFYIAMGFESVGQKRHHDLILQVYTKQLRPR